MNVGSNRLEKLERILVYTLDKFIEAIRKRTMIYDIDITRALQAQQQVNLLGFKASHEWVRRFKLAHQIVCTFSFHRQDLLICLVLYKICLVL